MFYFYLVNTRMRIKRDIEKGSSVRQGGVLLEILSGGSINPDPISDQNMPFSIRLYAP